MKKLQTYIVNIESKSMMFFGMLSNINLITIRIINY